MTIEQATEGLVHVAAMAIHGEDDHGNEYIVKSDNSILLKPKGSNKTLYIGQLSHDKSGGVAYMKKESEDQRYRKMNAWSINYHIFQHVDMIYFITEKDAYKISQSKASLNGKIMHFKNNAERKIYVPVEHWIKRSEQ